MSEYVGGNTIKDIKYPNFEEYVKEYEEKLAEYEKKLAEYKEKQSKGEEGEKPSAPSVNNVKYGGEVWKFLSDMQTIPAKKLEKIPGHYDKFLKNVKAIFKTHSYDNFDENSVLCFMDNKFIKEFDVEVKKYIKEGKNKERKDRLEEFWTNSFKPFTRRLSENVLCSNPNIKEKEGAELNRTINTQEYPKVYLGGTVWKKTISNKGTSIFSGHEYMKTLTLGKGVETVNTGTFWNCKELAHIYIEAEDLKIEKKAFNNCKKLNKVEVSSSVTKLTIEEGAFSNCPNLSNINLNSSSITFQNNKFMKTLTLGKGVETVNTGTFWSCEKLEHVYIEAEKLTIEKEAFKDCKALNKVKVCSSVTKLTIEEEAFSGCDKLKTIDLNSFSGKLEVESGAFNKCGELRRKSISGDEKSKAVLAIREVLPE